MTRELDTSTFPDRSGGVRTSAGGAQRAFEVTWLRLSLVASGLSILRRTEGLRIVEDVSFALASGQRLGLVGESGSGKSLTIRALVGLLRTPDWQLAGQILLDGVDLAAAPERAWQSVRGTRIGLVFQEPATALNPVLRVGTQVEEGMQNVGRAERRARAVELLRALQLPDPERCLTLFPHQLSGGMRQRVGLAMALAQSPEFLLADEPTTALDGPLSVDTLDLLDRMVTRRGMGLLLVAHDLALVQRRTDHLAVMYAGQLVESGPTEQVVQQPMHPYTQALLRAAPRLDGQLAEPIPGHVPPPGERPQGCRFAPRCAYATDRCHSASPELQRFDEAMDRRVRCFFPIIAHGADGR